MTSLTKTLWLFVLGSCWQLFQNVAAVHSQFETGFDMHNSLLPAMLTKVASKDKVYQYKTMRQTFELTLAKRSADLTKSLPDGSESVRASLFCFKDCFLVLDGPIIYTVKQKSYSRSSRRISPEAVPVRTNAETPHYDFSLHYNGDIAHKTGSVVHVTPLHIELKIDGAKVLLHGQPTEGWTEKIRETLKPGRSVHFGKMQRGEHQDLTTMKCNGVAFIVVRGLEEIDVKLRVREASPVEPRRRSSGGTRLMRGAELMRGSPEQSKVPDLFVDYYSKASLDEIGDGMTGVVSDMSYVCGLPSRVHVTFDNKLLVFNGNVSTLKKLQVGDAVEFKKTQSGDIIMTSNGDEFILSEASDEPDGI